MVSDARIGLVTGANQGLGRAVVAGLARAWGGQGTVYLTGRDRQRAGEAAAALATLPGLIAASWAVAMQRMHGMDLTS